MVSAHSSPLLSSTGGAFCRPRQPPPGRPDRRAPDSDLALWAFKLALLVNVLPCATCVYPNGRPVLTCAGFAGRRWLSGRPPDHGSGGWSNPAPSLVQGARRIPGRGVSWATHWDVWSGMSDDLASSTRPVRSAPPMPSAKRSWSDCGWSLVDRPRGAIVSACRGRLGLRATDARPGRSGCA
jgi:hypothetical protein